MKLKDLTDKDLKHIDESLDKCIRIAKLILHQTSDYYAWCKRKTANK